ncbi:hypothetical protein J6590_004058 [Homalodisca vitripennis]|nr:hypothetical protein J6590_004058 [Homalodisca vitripennis]
MSRLQGMGKGRGENEYRHFQWYSGTSSEAMNTCRLWLERGVVKGATAHDVTLSYILFILSPDKQAYRVSVQAVVRTSINTVTQAAAAIFGPRPRCQLLMPSINNVFEPTLFILSDI